MAGAAVLLDAIIDGALRDQRWKSLAFGAPALLAWPLVLTLRGDAADATLVQQLLFRAPHHYSLAWTLDHVPLQAVRFAAAAALVIATAFTRHRLDRLLYIAFALSMAAIFISGFAGSAGSPAPLVVAQGMRLSAIVELLALGLAASMVIAAAGPRLRAPP